MREPSEPMEGDLKYSRVVGGNLRSVTKEETCIALFS